MDQPALFYKFGEHGWIQILNTGNAYLNQLELNLKWMRLPSERLPNNKFGAYNLDQAQNICIRQLERIMTDGFRSAKKFNDSSLAVVPVVFDFDSSPNKPVMGNLFLFYKETGTWKYEYSSKSYTHGEMMRKGTDRRYNFLIDKPPTDGLKLEFIEQSYKIMLEDLGELLRQNGIPYVITHDKPFAGILTPIRKYLPPNPVCVLFPDANVKSNEMWTVHNLTTMENIQVEYFDLLTEISYHVMVVNSVRG